MRLKRLRNAKTLRGKRVLVRIDGNVPVKRGLAIDGPQGRIARSAVGLEWLRQNGARIIILTHRGRPGGKRVAAFSNAPIAKRLGGLFGIKVKLCHDVVGERAKQMVSAMQDGDMIMLENLRFHPGEEQNSRAFAQKLAALGDIYINDAFAVSHRAHASVEAITEEIPSYAGPLLTHEVSVLKSLFDENLKRPFVLLMGGLKMDDKLPVLETLLPRVDQALIGGALANAFLVAQGKKIGRSTFDQVGVAAAEKILKKWSKKIVLPSDVCVARRLSAQAKLESIQVEAINEKDLIVDLGNKSLADFVSIIETARTIVWNGPLGYCEVKKFCSGTHALAKAIAARAGKATTVVGGGDTVPVVEAVDLADHFTLVSTGGGAMLEFLAGKKLPGMEALIE
ncbi:MAG: Phosphoglycerate kinase [Candidatus Uhrbacteria bacterium GW2011_GWE2_45_35]|uniref:Phosphoglycerate kinase n=2 Tax=Candidatus Uhriibacteriota TaxID=1752732 RepID=A0A0G1ME72_9BACT|nr:MAG: Phosphoglycerate kinase [Candidatus Uhrbacteria bacterium GW2011_GWF2_44_350]KKU06644.1 MAG: Phosphoglycerate kinase [Candidatus Uhrbacteria bacterium GW2011_GWE2_45_35]HBR80708.1 phosphoglycerate kinase [Candidatus Uhrbacteria bacterium]HCU31670.1 phosphoglycerate kinase [Candidatus Uhrbacteria bacterium]